MKVLAAHNRAARGRLLPGHGLMAAALGPAITSVIFTAGSGGSPASLTLGYSGDGTGYTVRFATGTDPLTVSPAQMHARSGGTNVLEHGLPTALGTNIDVTGLTATSEAATRLAVCLINADGSGASNVVTIPVSGLDFTTAQLSAATTNTAGSLVTLTFTEALVGTRLAANWTVALNGTPQTPSAIGGSGNTVTLTLGTAATFGQTVTVSYSGGDLEDGAGNPLAAITGAAVTNAVSNPTGFEAPLVYTQTSTIRSGGATPSQTTAAAFPGAGSWLVDLASIHDNAGNSAFTLSGPAVTSAVLLTDSTGVKTGRVGSYIYWVTTSAASDLTVTETANRDSYNRRIIVQKTNGLTSAGAIVGNAVTSGTSFSVALAAVPAGRYVSAVFANRLAAMTGVAFSGSFVAGDEVHDLTAVAGADNFTTAVASADATATGTFTATITLTASSAHSVMSAVALAPII